MNDIYNDIESIFFLVTNYAVLLIEIIGVAVVLCSVIRAVYGLLKRDKLTRLKLAQGIALALEFKMGGELLRTVVVREWKELLILGVVILLRAAMAVLIHWEIKGHKRDVEEEKRIIASGISMFPLKTAQSKTASESSPSDTVTTDHGENGGTAGVAEKEKPDPGTTVKT